MPWRVKDEPNIRHKEDDRRNVTAALAVICVVVLIVAYTRIPQRTGTVADAPAVAATIFPLYDIVRNVAPEGIKVTLVLPPGASPHTFEPTPAGVTKLHDAQVIYAIGHGIDGWAESLAENAGDDVFVVDKGIALRKAAAGDEDGDAHEGSDGTDPHYWLSALNAMTIARTVSADLQERFPSMADGIQRAEQEYLSRLRELHTELGASIGKVANKRIVTLHDAWYYFADAYGLTIVGTFEPSAGREPTPRYLAELQAAIRDAGTTQLFSEPQIATTGFDAFVRDNGLTISVLDPIGGVPGRESYLNLMRFNERVFTGE